MKSLVLVVLLAVTCSIPACSKFDNPAQQTNGKIVLVTGATGTQGGAVARELLRRNYIVKGLTRNPASERALAMEKLGAEMIKGDFDDAASLASAMAGAYGVFAVTNFWEHGYDKEVAHGRQLIDAAAMAGVAHFVFTSVAGANELTGIPHFETKGEIEDYLRTTDQHYSIVRPVEFMDNIHYDRKQLMKGTFYDPRDSGRKHQWIAASDIGFFVGEAFDNPADWNRKELDIAGDELTIAEFTDVLSRTLGLDIHHQQISWSAYEKDAVVDMTLMMRWFDEDGYKVDVAALRRQYPHLQRYEQYLLNLNWQ